MRFKRLIVCILGAASAILFNGHYQAAEVESAKQTLQTSVDMRLIVVTDDDFLVSGQPAWCSRVLSRAVEEFRQLRPSTELTLELRPAGPPVILCGGRPQFGPRRAIGFLCDPDANIIGFFVGVPTGRQLAALVEDADEVAILNIAENLQPRSSDGETDPQDLVVEALHERSLHRVLRHYRPLVHKIKRNVPLADAAAMLQPALVADRGERFLAIGLPDALRWQSALQHTETMRHWCEAMLPCIVGRPVDAVWQDLAELLWESRPWQLPESDAELVDWYDQAILNGPVVLWVQTPRSLVGLPIAADNAAPAEPPADEQLQRWLDRVEHRQVGLPAVAQLLQHRQDQPTDLLRMNQAFTGWVVFTEKAAPTFIPSSAQRRFTDTMRKLLATP